MITENLARLFERDILKLKTEISAYTDEQKLWLTAGEISNSAGNLCLHLLGNLQHYIGHVLGNTSYVRDRPLEFSRKNVGRDDMVYEIDHTRHVVVSTLQSLPEETLMKMYPENVMGQEMTTEYFLLHLLAHLSYHLGQINYHRRLLGS